MLLSLSFDLYEVGLDPSFSDGEAEAPKGSERPVVRLRSRGREAGNRGSDPGRQQVQQVVQGQRSVGGCRAGGGLGGGGGRGMGGTGQAFELWALAGNSHQRKRAAGSQAPASQLISHKRRPVIR